MKSASMYTLICLFLISAVTVYPAYVYAQSTSSGNFVAYSFDYSGSKSGSGSLKVTVLNNFGNGTLRTELSGSLNNTDFMVKHNVAESKFHFPYLPTIPEFNQTMKRGNGTITISITRLADENVNLHDTTWVLNVSKVSITVEGVRNGKNMMASFSGDLKVFAKSSLFYGFSGTVKSGGNETQISIVLTDTNLDLNVKPASNMSGMLSQMGTLASLGMGSAPLSGQASLNPASMLSIGEAFLGSAASSGTASANPISTSPSTSLYTYLIIASLVGVVALVSVLSIRGLRRGRQTDSSEEKPLHWVR